MSPLHYLSQLKLLLSHLDLFLNVLTPLLLQVEALEAAAAAVNARVDAAKDRTKPGPRPTYAEMAALLSEQSAARRVADTRMERWLELEDLVATQRALEAGD